MLEQFGPYQLVRHLGGGGMGEVFEAVHADDPDGRRVAIKRLSPRAARDDELADRFLQECRLAKLIQHPHVLPVYECGLIEGRPFIAMYLASGSDLAAEIARGPLPVRRAIDLVDDVASALDAAHHKGLRHRDIKPSNILLEPVRRGHDHVYLIDWGIAQPIDTTHAPVTRLGTVVGTPAYIAPERLRDGRRPDHRADVYSLAVVLYECLAGSRPFGGEDVAVLMAHLSQQPPPLPDHVPPALREAVAIGMAKDPQERHASAGALADAARQALDHAPPVYPMSFSSTHFSAPPAAQPSGRDGTPAPAPAPTPVVTPPPTGGRPSQPHQITAQDPQHPQRDPPDRRREPDGGARRALPVLAAVAGLLIGLALFFVDLVDIGTLLLVGPALAFAGALLAFGARGWDDPEPGGPQPGGPAPVDAPPAPGDHTRDADPGGLPRGRP